MKKVINCSGLQADASGIEGDALSDKRKRLFVLIGRSFIVTNIDVDIRRGKQGKEEFAYISKNLAGSDVPWVTERKTFWNRIREKSRTRCGYHTMFFSAAQTTNGKIIRSKVTSKGIWVPSSRTRISTLATPSNSLFTRSVKAWSSPNLAHMSNVTYGC